MQRQTPEIHLDRLHYVAERFRGRARRAEGEDGAGFELILDLKFEAYWGELGRASSMDVSSIPYGIHPEQAGSLARVGAYVSTRLSDGLKRWFLVRRLYGEMRNQSGLQDGTWLTFAHLAVKDGHTDIASIMDAVALFLLTLDHAEDWTPPARVPGFGDLRSIKSRWRRALTPVSKQLVDATDDWFSFVKEVRNLLVHKQHIRTIFGAPCEGVAFQISTRDEPGLITAEPLLHRPAGGPIVDFDRYFLWMLAETIFFIDQVAAAAMNKVGMGEEDLMEGGRFGAAAEFQSALQQLIDSAGGED